MIGIKAIPARFGGFETAVDYISRGLVSRGLQVVVYNRSGMSTWPDSKYEGVDLVTLPTARTKNLSTIVHSFLAVLHVLFHRVDVVHFFTTGTTLFAPIVRLFGMKAVCSVDGTDWQRAKWGRFARWYLRLSEQLAASFCNGLIADSKEVQAYYATRFGRQSFLITYGMRERNSDGKEWLDKFQLAPRDYVLFVGRLVPENNIHHLIEAFEGVQTTRKLVIVGDDPWEREYVTALKTTKDPRIVFTGGVYGEGYEQLQSNAYLFVLPDEVGGTHPALVEAMGFGNCVLVNDTPSNLEVIQDAGFSYQGQVGVPDLRAKLQELLASPAIVADFRNKALERARAVFSWDEVVRKHERCYQQVLSERKQARAMVGAIVKRCMDFVFSATTLVILAPVLLLIGLLVRATSPGPALYRWRVVGKNGRYFTGYKFRSMYQDADRRKQELLARNEMQGPVFKVTNDPRITPLGRFLRKYSIDELPQLWCVLRGDMSLVGPRPPLQSEYEAFTEWQKQKLAVKPGLTCLWQVSGRNDISSFDDWVRLDLEYIAKASLWLDIKIIFRTVPVVLFGKGK